MHAVEPVRLPEKVRRRLRRAANAAHLRQLIRFDAVIEERLDQVIGDRVVAAAGAQRRRKPLVDFASQSDDVEIGSH